MRVALVFLFAAFILSIATSSISAFAVDISSTSCYNTNTSFSNLTIGTTNIPYYTNCPFGCNNATGTCNGTNGTSSINAMWITYATGSLFLVLGTILGIPYGKMTGEENIKNGFDTTIVVKYIFFFVGLFFMYLSLSMAYNNVNLYGGEANTLGGINTTLLTIMITIILFLFVFVIESLFYIFKRSFTIKEKEKWGEREEGE